MRSLARPYLDSALAQLCSGDDGAARWRHRVRTGALARRLNSIPTDFSRSCCMRGICWPTAT